MPLFPVAVCCSLLAVAKVSAKTSQAVVGDVRVTFLSRSLLRLEQKGPKGFENRPTFNVVERKIVPVPLKLKEGARYVTVSSADVQVQVPRGAAKLDGVRVLSKMGAVLYEVKGLPPHAYLPAPGQVFNVWTMADAPRIVPPAWGATPPPDGFAGANSGWDVDKDALDIYVFVNLGEGYKGLRRDFLSLTGQVPMPPRFIFGFIDSRYHPYTEQEALGAIDEYRRRAIPLDTFVVDTDWRVNGSHGYQVSEKHFPDMARFIAEAHKRNVKLMFNDHPEPVAAALDPKELRYRYEGLTSLLRLGMDVWWYDRNWGTHIGTPAPGLPLEVWGMRVYADTTQRFRPGTRPVIMSNVWGIDNGHRNGNTYPAMHRYPVWWTGDTVARWDDLARGIANGVDMGVLNMLPYVNEDLGGHIGAPSPELYVRFLQYGCFSPVTRVHCTFGQVRYPWAFGLEAERIVTEYIKLRYRLLPTLYAAVRRAYDDGTPLLRRCDLAWPAYKKAADPMQYLFGEDLLVAPVYESIEGSIQPIPPSMLRTAEGQEGLMGAYYDNPDLKGNPVLARIDKRVTFEWGPGRADPSVPRDNFSARWTGKIGPVPETGEYAISVRADDGVRLWIDGNLVIDTWKPQDNVTNTALMGLERGRTYDVKLEYNDIGGNAICVLGWRPPSERASAVKRRLWLPPGKWQDLWTGRTYKGPAEISVESPLWHMPLFARVGGIVVLGPDVQFTSEKPWEGLTLEAFVPSVNGSATRQLYEDDGLTNGYQRGECRWTPITLSRYADSVLLNVAAASGTFKGALKSRSWTLRLHLPAGESFVGLKVNGQPKSAAILEPDSARGLEAMPFRGIGARPAAEAGTTVEVRLPRISVAENLKIELKVTKGKP